MGALMLADELTDARGRLGAAEGRRCSACAPSWTASSRGRRRPRSRLPSGSRPWPPNSATVEIEPLRRHYLGRRRVLLRLASKASNPGDLNHPHRELSLPGIVASGTRRPPGLPGPRGLKRLHGSRGAATLCPRSADPSARDERPTLPRPSLRATLRAPAPRLARATPGRGRCAPRPACPLERLPPVRRGRRLSRPWARRSTPAPCWRASLRPGCGIALPAAPARDAPLVFRLRRRASRWSPTPSASRRRRRRAARSCPTW